MSFRAQRYFLAVALALLPVVIMPTQFFDYFLGIIVGVLLIIFSVGLGNATGWIAGGRVQAKVVDKTTPPVFVEVLGWVFLLGTLYVCF
jgi:hypothetical protein